MQHPTISLPNLTPNTLALSSDKDEYELEAHGKPVIHPRHCFFLMELIEKQTTLDHNNLFVNPYLEGDPYEIISEEDLPFTRFKLPPEEEEIGSIRTSTYVYPNPSSIDIKFTFLNVISTSMGCGYSRPAPYHHYAQVRCLPLFLSTMGSCIHSFLIELKMVKTNRSRHT